jgi:hypothetical protein
MTLSIKTVVFAFAAFGLFACMLEDKNTMTTKPGAGTGSARITLPTLPAGYLAKKAAGLAATHALFALTISGEGMDPIRKSWLLTPNQQAPVTIAGIPAGKMRVFAGRLIRIDSAGGDTVVTHEGFDSAWIQRDILNEVHLYLTAGGRGDAHVCVEVEGWPLDSTCIAPPDTTHFPSVGGCYDLFVNKPAPSGPDSIFKGKLSIGQGYGDSGLFATVTWNPGYTDSASGAITAYNGIRLEGIPGNGFDFTATRDSAGVFHGNFNDPYRGIQGLATAFPGQCGSSGTDTTVVDTTVVDTSIIDTTITDTLGAYTRTCFAFTQVAEGGKTVSGRMGFETWRGETWAGAYMHWNGYAMQYSVTSEYLGSLRDSALVKVGFTPQTGMFPKAPKVDSTAFVLGIVADSVSNGTIVRIHPAAGTLSLGTWRGVRSVCKDSDFEF